eukprot:676194-Rhodomonas_salina.1
MAKSRQFESNQCRADDSAVRVHFALEIVALDAGGSSWWSVVQLTLERHPLCSFVNFAFAGRR